MTVTTRLSAPVPHPAVETAYLAAEAVLYDQRTGRVYRLNPSASAVWMLLDGTADTEAIAADISEIFEVPVDQVTSDVATAVEQFAAQGLLLLDDGAWEDGGDGSVVEVPHKVRALLHGPPVDGEVAVPLPVYTRGGRAVLVHVADGAVLDHGRLAQGGVVQACSGWVFVAPDGASVAVGDLRWPLLGALVAGDGVDPDEARRRLWPLGRGNRRGWEALLADAAWVRAASGDVNDELEAALM